MAKLLTQKWPKKWPRYQLYSIYIYMCANGRGHFGEETAGGHPNAFPRSRLPLFAVLALRELESACRVGIL